MPLKNEKPDPRLNEMREGFLADAADLWDKNQDRFLALLNSSEQHAVKLTFTATLDLSQSEACMDVEIGYGQRFKDKRTRAFTDPNQETMKFPSGGNGNAGNAGNEDGKELEATPDGYKKRRDEERKGKKGAE